MAEQALPAIARTPQRRFIGIADRSTSLQLVLGIGVVLVSIVAPVLMGSEYWAHNFLIVNLFVSVAVLQNLLLSDAGQVSFGQGALFGLAAYTVGIVSGSWGYSYGVGVLAGLVAAVLLGLLYALPALRVQGYYLGFVTMSAAVVFPEFLVAFNDITNGINGITRSVPSLSAPVLGGFSWLAILVFLLTAGTIAAHAAFRQSALGRQMRIAAVSPEAAMTLGLSPGRLRFLAFTVAAFGTGLAGVLYVPLFGFVSPYAFRMELSIYFFFAVIVGGAGRLAGPVVGAWILYLVPNALLVDLANYRLLGYGLVALVIMLVFPDGLVGSIEKAVQRYRTRTRVGDVAVDKLAGAPVEAAATRAAAGPAVTVRDARKTYGRLAALDGVSATVQRGTIHGLVGPNGSGKTTLLNAISGLVRLDSGTIEINGRDTTRTAAYNVARLGVGRTFQTPRIFEDMSIWENLEIGADFKGARAGAAVLDAFAAERAHWETQHPDLLPHAQRRLLEVVRIVAMDVEILLFDEPAAGLSPEERRDFAALLRTLRDRMGKTIILVEHDLALVWRVADRITVLDAGAVIADGPPQAIVDDARVRALFTGGGNA